MDIIGKIRQLWSANAPLVALVPMTAVHTGQQKKQTTAPPYPHVEMSEGVSTQKERTSTSNYRNQQVTIQIWSDGYASGRRIRDLVIAPQFLLDRQITLEDSSAIDLTLDTSQVIEETDQGEESTGEKIFQFVVTFDVTVVSLRSSSGI